MDIIWTVLTEEHAETLRVLDAMEKALQPPDFAALQRAVDYFDNELALHRRKEEEVLFPALAPHLKPSLGPLNALQRDHELEEEYIDDLKVFLRLAEEDAAFVPALVEIARYVSTSLRDHIWKEDHFLADLSGPMFSEEERRFLVDHMAALESEGVAT